MTAKAGAWPMVSRRSSVWHRRLAVRCALPMPRVWLQGPKWQRAFNVQALPIAEVHPEAAKYHRPGATLLFYDFIDDVRELVCERLQVDVYAEWSDPRERFS